MIAGNPDAVVEAHTNDIEAFKKKFKDYLSKKKSRKGTVCKMHGVFFDARKSG